MRSFDCIIEEVPLHPHHPLHALPYDALQYADDLGGAMDASGSGAGLSLALAGVLGNARAAVRERGMGAANALMGALGPHALAGPVFAEPTLLHARNWRLREGVLRLYAAQVLAFGEGAAPAGDALTHAAATALTEAAPEMRRAAADALACLALSFAWSAAAAVAGGSRGRSAASSTGAVPTDRDRAAGLTRVLGILAQSADKGLQLRAVHTTAVRERHAALAASLDGAGGAGGSHDDAAGIDDDHHDDGHDGATGVAGGRGVSAGGAGRAAGGGGGGGGAGLGDTHRSTASAASAGSGGSGSGGGGSRPTTGKLHLKVPGPDGSAPPSSSLASSSGFSAASGSAAGSRAPTPSAASSGSGLFPAVGTVYAPSWDEAAADAAVNSLCELHASPLWRCGVVGFPPAEVGAVRPVAVASGRELAKVMDGILAVCATTTSDWNERSKALDRLRGLVAGGPANPTPSVDGFAGQVARARDALCTQVQELRSSLAKQACLAVAELSATLGGVVAAASGAVGMAGSAPLPSPAAAAAAAATLDSLIEPLVEVLTRLTSVSIAVISSSADAAVRSLLHNARAGCHRALPKLAAVCRGKSSSTRAHAAFYLLQALRGWPRACLERHADELAATVLALLRDADPNARVAARHAAWSLCAALPGRRDALLSSLDARTQRSLVAEEARTAALEAAAEHVCTAVVVLPPIVMSVSPGGGGGPSGGFVGLSDGASSASPASYSSGSGAGSGFYGGSAAAVAGPGAAARPASALGAVAAGSGRPGASGGAGGGGLPPSGASSAAGGGGGGGGYGSGYSSVASSAATSPTGAGAGGRPLSAPVLAAAGSAATYGAPNGSAAPSAAPRAATAAAGSISSGAAGGIAAGGVRGAAVHSSVASSGSAGTGTTVASAGSGDGGHGSYGHHRSASAATAPSAARHDERHDDGGFDHDDGGFVPPQLLSSPTPAGIGALVSRALTLAHATGAAAAAAASSAYPVSGHGHPLRMALADLHASLVACRALDARSAARAYADRLPSAAAGGLRAVIPAAVREEFGRANPGTQPLICDGYLAAPAALAFASQLLAPADAGAASAGGAVRLPASPSPLLRLLLSCLRHPHELVQLDGLALAFATLDACADVGGALSDALTDIMLPWGAPPGAAGGGGAAASAAAAAAFGPEALALALDHGAAVVRLFTVKVQSQAAPTPAAAAPASRLVSVAPVYARLMLLQTAGPLAGIDPAGGAASAGGSPTAAAGSAGSGPVVPLPSPFLDVLQWVIALSAVGGSDALRAAARRVIAALRRAYPLPVLLPAVVACMGRPLTGAAAAGTGAGAAADGAAEAASARTARTHAACLMLTLSLLGDAGGASWLLAPSHAPALARLLSRAAAIAASPMPAPAHLSAAAGGDGSGSGGGAGAPHPDMTQYAEGALRLLAGSDPARVGAAVASLRPEERTLWARIAAGAGIPLHVPAPAPVAAVTAMPAAAPAPSAVAVAMRPPPAVPSAAASAAPASAAAPTSASAAAAGPLPLAFPMSRPSLELVREALASGEHERVTRALHYLGRQVDVIPASAAASSGTAADGAPMLPLALPPVPAAHAEDAAFLSLVERTGAAVLAVAEAAAGLRPLASVAAGGPAGISSFPVRPASGSASSSGAGAAADASLLSTSLSVLRKLFRNAAAYMLPCLGGALTSLLACAAAVSREELVVVERTLEEAAERMPAAATLSHLVAAACTVHIPPPLPAATAGAAPADASGAPAAAAAAAANAAGGVAVACFRALARLAPRMPAHLLLDECARGRLMAAVQAGFGSGASDVRRAVLTLLVALTLHLRSAFARYADAYLSPAQSKLVAVYVDKALAAQAAAAHVAGGAGAR